MRQYRFLITALLLLSIIPPLTPGQSLAENYAVQDVKVAFLYNIAKFVSWPQTTPEQTIVLGILGEDPFGPALKKIKGKTIQSRPLDIRPVLTIAEAEQCHLLFISRSEKNRLDKWLPTLQSRKILIISDIPNFIDHGGMLELIEIDQRIRFAVNLDAIHDSGLRLDAQLLNLAYRVRHEKRTR